MCSAVSDEVVYHCHYELYWASPTLMLRKMENIELLHGFSLYLIASLSFSLSPWYRFWQHWTETATAANTSCDTNWNKPLTWCLAAVEGSKWLDGRGGRAVRGWGGSTRHPTGWFTAEHPQLVLAWGEAKTLDNQKGTTAQHMKPNVFPDHDLYPRTPSLPNARTSLLRWPLLTRPSHWRNCLTNFIRSDYCGSDTFQWERCTCQDGAMEKNDRLWFWERNDSHWPRKICRKSSGTDVCMDGELRS